MAVNPLAQLRGTPPPSNRTPITGRVTGVDANGIDVVPIGGDQRTPVSGCRGPSDIPVGTIVMVIWTQERPWVFGAELITTLSADARDLALLEAAEDVADTRVQAHADDHDNPHQVTADQVGLGQVDNTSDLDKPISTATQDALDAKVDTAAYGDTGLRVVVSAGDVDEMPDLEVITRRRGDVVEVFTREAFPADHDAPLQLTQLPLGFRPDPPVVATDVSHEDGERVIGARFVVDDAGAVSLDSVAGARHYAALTYLTSDPHPTELPGTED